MLVVRLDVSDSQSVNEAFVRADEWLGGEPLRAVLNCAAICPLGAVEIESEQVLLDTLNTNAVGTARLIKAALPRLRGHDGRIVLVASLWGRVSGPMLSAYCASKFAIEAIADATRREIAGQDVKIILVEPGVVRTALVENQVATAERAIAALSSGYVPLYRSLYSGYHKLIAKNADGGISAEKCARQIEAAMWSAKPRPRYRIGIDSKVVTTLARLLPDRALDAAFSRLVY